jgi:hypothetical protein
VQDCSVGTVMVFIGGRCGTVMVGTVHWGPLWYCYGALLVHYVDIFVCSDN